MKKILLTFTALVLTAGLSLAFAEDGKMHMDNHHHDIRMMDSRTSLGLSPEMKQHQLSNMREHVEAITSIVGLMADRKFEDASKIAHTKLGLTPEMQSMCSTFGDEKFKEIGFAFHKSGDDLGNVLQTKDINASLRALNKTMEYCVSCHAVYRQ